LVIPLVNPDTSSFFLLCFNFFSHRNSLGIFRGNILVGKIPRKFTDENIPSVFPFVFIGFLVVDVLNYFVINVVKIYTIQDLCPNRNVLYIFANFHSNLLFTKSFKFSNLSVEINFYNRMNMNIFHVTYFEVCYYK
jgi:hypothetical protein